MKPEQLRRVSEIRIFPIKGFCAVELESAEVEPRGLKHDRRFMLTDSHGIFLSQRKISSMTLFSCQIESNSLKITSPDGEPIHIPFELYSDKILVKVWGTEFEAWKVSMEIDEWFSSKLGTEVQLVCMDDDCHRPISKQFQLENAEVSFADGSPVTLNNLRSLETLTESWDEPLPIDRFRANITIDGFEPWEEEGWHKIRIGSATFQILLRCGRCQVPSIDQISGIVPSNPTLILDHIRNLRGNGDFGVHMVPIDLGIVSVGDSVAPIL